MASPKIHLFCKFIPKILLLKQLNKIIFETNFLYQNTLIISKKLLRENFVFPTPKECTRRHTKFAKSKISKQMSIKNLRIFLW